MQIGNDMKTLLTLKYIIFVFIIVLLLCNIFVFLKSIKLGDEINKYEKEITRLHQENSTL